MINQKYVYHASMAKGLKVLEPRVDSHKIPLVYASTDIVVAALFLGNNGDILCQRLVPEEVPYLWERFDGAFDLGYKGKSGSIYYLKPDTFKENMTRFPLEVVSEVPVEVEKELFIEDVQEYLLKLDREGKLKIFFFPNSPEGVPKNKEDIVEKAINWTIDFGEDTLRQIEEYHPDVLDRVIEGLQKKGYRFKSKKWLSKENQ